MQARIAVALIVIVGLLAYGAYHRRSHGLPFSEPIIASVATTAVAAALIAAYLDLPVTQATVVVLTHSKTVIGYPGRGDALIPADISGADLGNVLVSALLGALVLTAAAAVVYARAIRAKR